MLLPRAISYVIFLFVFAAGWTAIKITKIKTCPSQSVSALPVTHFNVRLHVMMSSRDCSRDDSQEEDREPPVQENVDDQIAPGDSASQVSRTSRRSSWSNRSDQSTTLRTEKAAAIAALQAKLKGHACKAELRACQAALESEMERVDLDRVRHQPRREEGSRRSRWIGLRLSQTTMTMTHPRSPSTRKTITASPIWETWVWGMEW